MTASYQELLAGKAQVATEVGVPDMSADAINTALYPLWEAS